MTYPKDFRFPQLPQAWISKLAQVKSAGFPEAVIAGGALRDLLLDRPVKDVDIFLNETPLLSARDALAYRFPLTKVITQQAFNYVGSASDVSFAASLDASGEYQVIALTRPDLRENPKGAYERVDFGICRVAHDGYRWFVDPAFLNDATLRTFTVLRCDNADQALRSLQRYRRLLDKYPGYKLVIPAEVEVQFLCWFLPSELAMVCQGEFPASWGERINGFAE